MAGQRIDSATTLQEWRTLEGVRVAPRIATAQASRAAQAMAQQLALPLPLAELLAGRGIGIDEAEAFLNPSLKASLPDPSHLLDMDKAVQRIVRALETGETIAVFGDYDVDGATSSALLQRYFAALGVPILVYIPDRMKEGYGPNLAAFEQLKAQGASVIITVDCGIVAYDPIAAIAQQGVDVIILDHHQALPRLPDAVAVINPNRIDQDSECGHLAAVGVVFLFLVALNRALKERQTVGTKLPLPDLLNFLDLVALGTVCDVVSLHGINRAFVAQGLKVMMQRRNAGLTALADVAQLDEAPTAYHAGFLLGPRINAGGRVGAAGLGARLLASDNRGECSSIAAALDGYNRERQAIEAMVLEEAMAQAESQANMPCIIVAKQGWHEGVIGIVAGRIKETYNRPSAVITWDEAGNGKGSARSVAGADMGAAIASACLAGHLQKGGGHAMAAGFSLSHAQWEGFCAFLNATLSQAVSDYQLGRTVRYDALISVSGATLGLVDALERAAPFGMGNPAPRLLITGAQMVECSRLKEIHLRATLADASGGKARLKAMAFKAANTALGDALERAGRQPISLLGQLKRNRWQGYESAQFIIDDVVI
jgi:single-stranded-DNA-specific exonuclease